MKVRKGLRALAFVSCLAGASVASADTLVWFTSPSGTLGANNVLTLPGPGTYTVTAMAQTSDLAGYSIDLIRGSDTGIAASNVTYLVDTWSVVEDVPFYNFDEFALWGAGEAALGEPSLTGGPHPLFSFDLTIAPGSTGNISAGIGIATFAPTQLITFGASTPVDAGDSSAVGNVPVIVIPEPASLVLLGIGALALVRRRR